MKWRLSLTWKIALLAVLTLVMLSGVLLIFGEVQFRISPENFIVAPALNRILSVQGELAQDLLETPVTGRAELLTRFSKEYGVEFYLVDANGQTLTGSAVALSAEIIQGMARFRNEPGRWPVPQTAGRPPQSSGPRPRGLALFSGRQRTTHRDIGLAFRFEYAAPRTR
jgi:hypothetical protein